MCSAPRSNAAPIPILASFSGAGGVERMLVNLIEGLLAQGRAVELLLIRAEGPHLAAVPAAVHRVPLGARHALAAVPALARWLRREQPAALLVAKDRAGRAAVLARALAGTRTRLLLRLGTNLSAAMAGRPAAVRVLRYAPIRLLYPHLDQVIAVSAGVAADTARIAGLPPTRISVIRNPVLTPGLTTQAALPCPHPWLAAGCGQDAPPVIVAAGRLERQKDFPTLLRAFAGLRRQRPARLLILGEGGGRAGLEQLAGALGLRLGPAGDFDLPGFQSNPYSFFARAHLFVLSSAWEGSPNALTEALALGIPVVATDCPSGPRELLAHGRYGPLVPVGDADALAAAMAATLADPLPATLLRAAVHEYQRDLSAARYLALIDGLPGDR
ncbi:MAG: glycosyltransferase [Chromatiaceae bacterium]|nr:MAG: glycosyltransferase [Chromatiaceae bacterium]